jgi:hypothetical protein
MSLMKVTASEGSVAVGGDNKGQIFNALVSDGSTVNFNIQQQQSSVLTSLLGEVIIYFSRKELSQYAQGPRREMPPEVNAKLQYNAFDPESRIMRDYRRYGNLIDRSYLGVEQENPDAHRLVRRAAGLAYDLELEAACASAKVAPADRSEFARKHSSDLVSAVISRLLEDYKSSGDDKVAKEYAHLAVCLVVADAIIECEVLERPPNVVTS